MNQDHKRLIVFYIDNSVIRTLLISVKIVNDVI